jgi:DNA-binding IscR family transcriptional regulator
LSALLTDLHRSELVTASRGRHGGYVLARDPGAISLADVMVALDDIHVPFTTQSPLALVWDELHRATLETAERTTVSDLVRRLEAGNGRPGDFVVRGVAEHREGRHDHVSHP